MILENILPIDISIRGENQMLNIQDQLVPVSQAGKLLGISTTTLYRYEKKGLIQPYRTIGGHRRYNLIQLQNFREDIMNSDLSKPGRRRLPNE